MKKSLSHTISGDQVVSKEKTKMMEKKVGS